MSINTVNRFVRATADATPKTTYHAHVYYTPQTRPMAQRLRDEVDQAHLPGVHVDAALKPTPDIPYHRQTEFEISMTGPASVGQTLHALSKIRGPLPVLVHEDNVYRLKPTHLDEAWWLGGDPPGQAQAFIDPQAFVHRQLHWDQEAKKAGIKPIDYMA